jgi:hypothetical protein
MHRVITRQCSLVCALLCILRLVTADRGDAFIGYQEKENLCVDTNDGCEKWSKGVLSQCIENAYYMRQFCRKASPPSALLQRCISLTLHEAALTHLMPFSCSPAPSRRTARPGTTTCHHGRGMPRRRARGSSPQCTLAPTQQQSTTSAGTPAWGTSTLEVRHRACLLYMFMPTWHALTCNVPLEQARRCGGRRGCT